jgi:hypothetical protein
MMPALTDLLAAQQMLAAALTEHPAQALAHLAAWLDPIRFIDDVEDTDDELLRVLGICRGCFPDVYGEAAGAVWDKARDVKTVLCDGMSRHLVAPVRFLEDLIGGIPFEAYGIDLDGCVADPDCTPSVVALADQFGIPDEHSAESMQPIAKILSDSLEKRGETGAAHDMAMLLQWAFAISENTLVSMSNEDLWESGIEPPDWEPDGVEFMNEVQREANAIMDAVQRALDVLERDPAWIEAFQANIRRIKERKASHDRLDLQWP